MANRIEWANRVDGMGFTFSDRFCLQHEYGQQYKEMSHIGLRITPGME